MSPTIGSLVIPVSDLDAAKAVYTALLGSPHTDESYYVGYNINGFEVALNPAGAGGGPVAFADVEDPDGLAPIIAGCESRSTPKSVISIRRAATKSRCGLRSPTTVNRSSTSRMTGRAARSARPRRPCSPIC